MRVNILLNVSGNGLVRHKVHYMIMQEPRQSIDVRDGKGLLGLIVSVTVGTLAQNVKGI